MDSKNSNEIHMQNALLSIEKGYAIKAAESNEVLKRFSLDLDSWKSNKKRELVPLVLDCVKHLKKWNSSSVDSIVTSFGRSTLYEIDKSMENRNRESIVNIIRETTVHLSSTNEEYERYIGYSDTMLNTIKSNFIKSEASETSSRDRDDVNIDEDSLLLERILKLIEKEKDLENEVKTLREKRNTKI